MGFLKGNKIFSMLSLSEQHFYLYQHNNWKLKLKCFTMKMSIPEAAVFFPTNKNSRVFKQVDRPSAKQI